MAVFLTGGGFIGYWILRDLVSEGKEVILYDIIRPPFEAIDPKKVTFIQGDILDYPRLASAFQDHRSEMEGIVHTAAIIYFRFFDNAYRNVCINVMGTLNLLELARTFQIKKFVYTSTCGIYGSAEGPLQENKTPVNPMDLYSASKASGEFLGLQYANHWGIDFRCARLYFVYGPPALPSTLPHTFQVLFGPLEGLDHLALESGRDQQLDITYVKDAAKGILLLYQKGTVKNRVFNIAGGRAYKMTDIVEAVKKHSRATSIEIGPGPMSPPRGFPIDISLARQELGFEPQYSLEKGISEYSKWIKQGKAVS